MATETVNRVKSDYKEIVKATVPILQERGAEITARFYQLLFQNHPELKNIFNQTNQRKGDQSVALANMVYAAALHIDNLAEIIPQVMPVAHKHTSLNIKPEYYPIVGENLLMAMRQVLGEEVATDEVIAAWEIAYGEIAAAFIGIEKEMYAENVKKGGWTDYKDFKVVDKVKESDVITSFYLEPADGGKLPTFKPGQYVTVKADIDGEDYTHQRQYSLSCAPNEKTFRISVKREDPIGENPAGIVSNYLHRDVEEGSILSLSCPSGDFVLDMNDTRPLILLSGGVGLTPMMSMLESALIWQPEREVLFIHAARSGKFHAMKERLQEVTKTCKQVTSYTVYDHPTETDAGQFDREGFIDAAFLKDVLPTNDAAFYFCGPKGFMRAMYQNLKSLDVAEDDIHFEIFGPATDIKG
ncbi:NO-inducible flavohemoprotein [Virgibacillus sp. 179-BFC.A HS]|uniref:Flavohemoprotein n=1 Tax=Tigheibacillus jepli TaxID=3035914 RepID=A0ABU5CCQ3_9BACI|nr:NO-inducible flavohemoprotein [Virgibacillus sp. 179-BFC.A HS]MDY0404098.1 NO-inducible flavohemoprotein [Virgibacillus sp. 179-BFC.A HS]